MIKIVSLFFVFFILVGCNSSDQKIKFIDEHARVSYCFDNVDDVENCSIYRPLFVDFLNRLVDRGLPVKDSLLNSDLMKRYQYTEQYRKDVSYINKNLSPRDVRLKSFMWFVKS